MRQILRAFLRNESGATAIEYGLIASLLSIAIILGATTLGAKLNTTFNAIAPAINGPAS